MLLQVSGHLNWKTPSCRSTQYVEAIIKELGVRAQAGCGIKNILRTKDVKTGEEVVIATNFMGVETTYDNVVFACHPYQILQILGDNATPEEISTLECFKYSTNDTYVHSDETLMPKAKSAWTSWNYIGTSNPSSNQKPVYVTYWLNKLQKLNHTKDIFVSLNPHTIPAIDKIYSRIAFSHPQYSTESVKAQKKMVSLQGYKGTYFCG